MSKVYCDNFAVISNSIKIVVPNLELINMVKNNIDKSGKGHCRPQAHIVELVNKPIVICVGINFQNFQLTPPQHY